MGREVRSLLRKGLRILRKDVPPRAHAYYLAHMMQNFRAHADEDDPQRIRQIVERASQDMDWVREKYRGKDGSTP